MTYDEANRIVITLNMNFATFLPRDPEEAAAKRNMWISELVKYDFKKGLEAAKMIITTSPYAPTIYDLKQALGHNPGLTRDEMMARLPGPSYDRPESYYTANMDRVNKMMADLDKELAALPDMKGHRE
jgi:hypothetical protein